MQNGDDILHYTLVQDQLSCTTDVYFGRDSSAMKPELLMRVSQSNQTDKLTGNLKVT